MINKLQFFLLLISIVAVILAVPFFMIIQPVYQRHLILEKKRVVVFEIKGTAKKIPEIIKKNKRQSESLQKKSPAEVVSLSSIDEVLSRNRLHIESMKPYESNEHDEVHLALKGGYQDFIRFLSVLAGQPNAMHLVSISIDKNIINIIFKNQGM